MRFKFLKNFIGGQKYITGGGMEHSEFFLTPSQRLERCMSIVTSMTTGVSEREANDALNAYVSIILSPYPFLLL